MNKGTPEASRGDAVDRGVSGGQLRGVPWWGLLSSAAAPILVIGGWTIAAALQPDHFDPVTQTISALAAHGASDRWVMTVALVTLGICHITTGLALWPAALPGRLLLITGGVATIVVAANPLPAAGGGSLPHGLAAGAGFVALAFWPAAGWRRGRSELRGRSGPGSLRPAVVAAAVTALAGLLAWFALELWTGGDQIGLSERAVSAAEAIWPLTVVITARWQLSRAPMVPDPAR